MSQGYDPSASSQAEREWDWESRKSAYSTVCDPDDDSWCEACDSEVDYSDPTNPHGVCRCDRVEEVEPGSLFLDGYSEVDPADTCPDIEGGQS